MDARPQRPVRAVRVQGDENAAPVAQTKQSIHQRHKSTGTLSNMLAVGGLKAAAKRTAFGDVTNTLKSVGATRDDSGVGGKVTQDKQTALLKPAQRLNNTNTAKGNFTNPAELNVKSLPSRLEVKQDAPAVKRTQSKKLPTIFKDDDTPAGDEQADSMDRSAVADSADIPLVRQKLGARRQSSPAQLPASVRRAVESNIPQDSSTTDNAVQLHPRALEQQDNNAVQVESRQTIPLVLDEEYEAYMKSLMSNQTEAWPKLEDEAYVERQLPSPPRAVEPEEYWDDDEEEVYDEQGYTTAHSYRTHGDNTTGGATTIPFPKITNKVKQELAAAKHLVESSRTQDEIDDEAWDTSMVAEYGEEIFGYMRELEIKMLPNANYMDLQSEIQWSMRAVLMDWLIQVHHRFSLLPETLFLCVNYIDRFLSCKIVSLGKLQLVGATAIFVAAKYEEINCPSVNEIVYMVDGGYTVDEILKAERFMLSMLQFELGWPGPMSFLRRISKADDYDLETRTLAKYFLEVTIMDERFVGSPPSYVAAGAHCFARFLLKKGDWTPAHAYYSGYTWTQMRPLVAMIMECCDTPQKHHAAVFEKYSDRRYKRASVFTQSELAKGFTLPPTFISRPSLPAMEDVAAHMQRMVEVKN